MIHRAGRERRLQNPHKTRRASEGTPRNNLIEAHDLRPRPRIHRRAGRDAGRASAAADSQAARRSPPPRHPLHRPTSDDVVPVLVEQLLVVRLPGSRGALSGPGSPCANSPAMGAGREAESPVVRLAHVPLLPHTLDSIFATPNASLSAPDNWWCSEIIRPTYFMWSSPATVTGFVQRRPCRCICGTHAASCQ